MSDYIVTSFKQARKCPICHQENQVQVDYERHKEDGAERWKDGAEARPIMKVKCDRCGYEIPFEAPSLAFIFLSMAIMILILILVFAFLEFNNWIDWIIMALTTIFCLFIGVWGPLYLMDWYMSKKLTGKELDEIIIDEYAKLKSREKSQ